MIIYFLILPALAFFDANFSTQGRSYPFPGGEAGIEVGYNYKWWKEPASPILYGLLRPAISTFTSGVINTLDAKIEFYPISFLGFSIGETHARSETEFPFFDCQKYHCRYSIRRQYYELKLALGWKKWALISNWREEYSQVSRSSLAYADFREVLIGNPARDELNEWRFILNRSMPIGNLAVIYKNSSYQNSAQKGHQALLIYQWGNKNLWAVGSGFMETDQVGAGPQMVFRWTHIFQPNAKLF